MILVAVTLNVHVVRDRDERVTAPCQEHVQLSSDAETHTHVSLNAVPEQNVLEEYANGICRTNSRSLRVRQSRGRTRLRAGRPMTLR